jgi:hypothetical protein
MLHGLAAYLLAAMTFWAPPSVHDYTRTPRAETEARYESIAVDLTAVVNDPDEVPLFAGEVGRAQTALVMLAIASYESGQFRADVDQQIKPSGDGGHAWCLGQLHDSYAKGLTDRVSCFRGMLRALRDSWSMCQYGPPADRITGYTVGHCEPGEPQARRRMERAFSWWSKHPYMAPIASR